MKKIIGSKMALKLAKKEFGERTYVERNGKLFIVGKHLGRWGNLNVAIVRGRGKSWAEALKSAGIVLPIEATIAGEVHAALFKDGVLIPKPSDTLPTDTDAKEPDNGQII